MVGGGLQDIAVIAAAETAMASQYHEVAATWNFRNSHQRMIEATGCPGKIGRELREFAGIWLGGCSAPIGGLELSSRDELHRTRDLARIPDRLAALYQCSSIRHNGKRP